MSVWVCIPSARPVPEVEAWAARWKCQGYKIALWRDAERVEAADICVVGPYQGYSKSANALIRLVLDSDPECSWVVGTGDDTWPDPNRKADKIAKELTTYFHGTFGACQPCGDDWRDHLGRIIERIAGSPFLGRELCLRLNQGTGVWWHEYHHSWADQELQEVCLKLGVFLQRQDLCHFHDHPLRYPGGKWPAHLQGVSADYTRMKPLFEERRKNNFPGSEPL
jgi:hypothetical protein